MYAVSVYQSVCHMAEIGFTVQGSLPNHFGLLLLLQRAVSQRWLEYVWHDLTFKHLFSACVAVRRCGAAVFRRPWCHVVTSSVWVFDGWERGLWVVHCCEHSIVWCVLWLDSSSYEATLLHQVTALLPHVRVLFTLFTPCVLYYFNMVECSAWSWWPTGFLQCFDAVGWVIWGSIFKAFLDFPKIFLSFSYVRRDFVVSSQLKNT